jgi:hypothetical protein
VGRDDVCRTLHELAEEYEFEAKALEDDERTGRAGRDVKARY